MHVPAARIPSCKIIFCLSMHEPVQHVFAASDGSICCNKALPHMWTSSKNGIAMGSMEALGCMNSSTRWQHSLCIETWHTVSRMQRHGCVHTRVTSHMTCPVMHAVTLQASTLWLSCIMDSSNSNCRPHGIRLQPYGHHVPLRLRAATSTCHSSCVCRCFPLPSIVVIEGHKGLTWNNWQAKAKVYFESQQR